MNGRTRKYFLSMLVVLLLGILIITSCEGDPTEIVRPTSESEQIAPATLDGQTLVEQRCTRCHDLARTTNATKTPDEWRATVERMVGKGADLSPLELEVVIQYLAETYP